MKISNKTYQFTPCVKRNSFHSSFLKHARHFILPAYVCLSSFTMVQAQVSPATDYLKTYAPVAQKIANETGIPASIILGIALIESGHGSSKNCQTLHNHFGVVGKNSLQKNKSSYRSMYKEYASDEASYRDFIRVVQNKRYYTKLKGTKNYLSWLHAMNKAHYSSAEQVWINRISKAIQKHQLYKYDGIYSKQLASCFKPHLFANLK